MQGGDLCADGEEGLEGEGEEEEVEDDEHELEGEHGAGTAEGGDEGDNKEGGGDACLRGISFSSMNMGIGATHYYPQAVNWPFHTTPPLPR